MEDVLSYNVIGEIKEASIRKISWSWADILILGLADGSHDDGAGVCKVWKYWIYLKI
jgi:hypothetical protein